MTITVDCQGCGRKYKFEDSLAGESIACKDCGDVVQIPAANKKKKSSQTLPTLDDGEQPLLRRKSSQSSAGIPSRSEDDEAEEVISRKPPKSSGSMRAHGSRRQKSDEVDEAEEVISRKPPKSSATIRAHSSGRRRSKAAMNDQLQMLAVGGGVLVVVVILGVIFGGGGAAGPSLAPPVNTPPPAPVQPLGGTPAPVTPPAVSPAPITPTPAANGAAPLVTPPAVVANTPMTTPANSPTPTPTTPELNGAPTAGVVATSVAPGWTVTADPAPEPLVTTWATDWSVTASGNGLSEHSLSYPATVSPFALFGNASDVRTGVEIWNLATGKRAATMKGVRLPPSERLALSPDGKYVAWPTSSTSVAVYDTVARQPLGELSAILGNVEFNLQRLEFASSSRLVAFSTNNPGLRTWSLTDGQLLHATPLNANFANPYKASISPGGRYVAIEANALDGTIEILDAASGLTAGTIRVQANPKLTDGELFLLAFSPDGNRLAAVFEATGSNGLTQIVLWDLADGRLASEHLISPSILQQSRNIRETIGVQWFGDSRKLLLHGVALIDVESGQLLYQWDKPTPSLPTSRRPLGPNHFAELSGSPRELTLKPVTISDSDLQRAATLAEAQGLPIDLRLPPLTKAELATPRPSEAGVNWTMLPSAPPTTVSVSDEPLALKPNKGLARGVQLAFGARPQAFIRFSTDEDAEAAGQLPPDPWTFRDSRDRAVSWSRSSPLRAKTNWIEVYDLTTRQPTSRVDVPFSADLVSVSPDGRRLLLQPHDGQGRLDVWDVAANRPVAAFRPYRSLRDLNERDVRQVALLDADHIATQSAFDVFAVWELPTCRCVYAVSQSRSFVRSPEGQVVAIATDAGVDLRDALTGEARGFVAVDGVVHGLAYAPNGERLAILSQETGGSVARTIDLKTGTVLTNVPTPSAAATACDWFSDPYVLAHRSTGPFASESRLIDFNTGAVSWIYDLPEGVLAQIPATGRLWYLASKPGKTPVFQLVNARLPEAAAAKVIAQNPATVSLDLKAGDAVAVRFNVAAPRSRPQLENEVMSLVYQAVERSGMTVSNGAPVQLQVTAESKTGGATALRPPGSTEEESVVEQSLILRFALKRGGEQLWSSTTTLSNVKGVSLDRLSKNDFTQERFDKDFWSRVSDTLRSLELPATVFSAQARNGLGRSTLGPTGPVVDANP